MFKMELIGNDGLIMIGNYYPNNSSMILIKADSNFTACGYSNYLNSVSVTDFTPNIRDSIVTFTTDTIVLNVTDTSAIMNLNFTMLSSCETATAIEEISSNKKYKIHPTPFSNELIINAAGNELISDIIVEFINLEGKIVHVIDNNIVYSTKFSINTFSLIPGFYFIRAHIGGNEYIFKNIKLN